MTRQDWTIPLSQPDIGPSERAAVDAVLQSDTLSRGPCLQAFERDIANYTGVAHAVALSSGTAALHLGMLASGIGPGDEVITTAFSVPASLNAILQTGATPVLVDIEPETRAIDPRLLDAARTGKCKAVLLVHAFGQASQIASIRNWCTAENLILIEDACEALGTKIGSNQAGQFGDFASFGFYPNKQITMGEGGVLVTDDNALAERVATLGNHGRSMDGSWLDQHHVGWNYRLPEVNAALGQAQLSRLDKMLAARRRIVSIYMEGLAGIPAITLPQSDLGATSWFSFVIECEARDALVAHLAKSGVQAGKYFAPLHWQPVHKDQTWAQVALPVTETIAQRCVALPLSSKMTSEQAHIVAQTVSDFF